MKTVSFLTKKPAGKTENDLLKLFKRAYMFRPAYMRSTPGLKNTKKYYKFIAVLEPVLKLLAPNYVSSLREVGQAMIKVMKHGYHKPILEVPDINVLAKG